MSVFLGLAVGNFIYAYFSAKQDWTRAIETSFYQAMAIFAYWLF